MAVIDASVVAVFLTEPDVLSGTGALEAIDRGGRAPHLIDAEVGHVLRRRVRDGVLSPTAGAQAIDDLSFVSIRRAPHDALLERAWELRDNLSFYDALYVALAEQLGAALLTFDRRLAGAAGLRCDVEVL